ncbi:MAG: ATP-binding protein [Candidatus Kapabacteria bacterium]|nr:ATP-binding protein [Candidatus Kapabacteria bacterium]
MSDELKLNTLESILKSQNEQISEQYEEIFQIKTELYNYKNAILNASIVSITDKKGYITFANQNFVDISGYSKEELIGKFHNIVNSGLHPKSVWNEMWKTIKNGKIWRGEVRNKKKSGEFYWVDSFIIPFYDNNGKIIEYLSIRNDITDKMKHEEQVKLSELRLKAIYESTSDINIFIGLDYKIISFNKTAFDFINIFLGKEIGEGLDFLDFVHSNYLEEFKSDFEKAKKGKQLEFERLIQNEYKVPTWFLRKLIPVKDDTGEIIGIVLDSSNIDERKKAELLIIEEREKALEVANLKSNILNNLSHEFRTPINGIFGFSELIRQSYQDEDLNEMIGFIYNSAKRLNNTLESILLLSKLVSIEKYKFINSRFNLIELINKIALEFNEEVKDKGIYLNFEFPSNFILVHSDEELIRQLIFELLSNAIKFTLKGGIIVYAEQIDSEVNIFVRDTGVGIDPKFKEEIFKEFRQGSEGLNRNFEGIGLGLTISEKIIELLNGKIRFESQLNKGTTFYFTFLTINEK